MIIGKIGDISIMFYKNGEFYWKPCYMYCPRKRYKKYKWTFDGAWLWFEISMANTIKKG